MPAGSWRGLGRDPGGSRRPWGVALAPSHTLLILPKDKDGKRLVQLFCQPTPKNWRIRRATRQTHPEDWARFTEYCRLDVEAMREVIRRLPRFNFSPAEVELWRLDQTINDRGFSLELDLVRAAIELVDDETAFHARRTATLTAGEVASAIQRDKLLRYLARECGAYLPDLQAATVERALEDERLPELVRQLLITRCASAGAARRKYEAMSRSVSADGRVRGTLQFCGASRTGRWAGRRVQPQNFPRPTLKAAEVERGIAEIKGRSPLLDTADPSANLNAALRGCIVAAPERKLVVSDLGAIEGRCLAWLAGEGWKLDALPPWTQAGGGGPLPAGLRQCLRQGARRGDQRGAADWQGLRAGLRGA